jgi:hypothetical protein
MALRPRFSLIHSEFNEFLFASVGEETNGMQLTVLSALTRLGLDPWGEAARLSVLPKETASRGLAAAIAMLPEGNWKVSDSCTIAARLVDRLPRRNAPAVQPSRGVSNTGEKTKHADVTWLVCFVLAAVVFVAIWHLHADHVLEPVRSTVSSMQR